MEAYGIESKNEVVESPYYMLFYLVPIVNNMPVGKVLKWLDLNDFKETFNLWSNDLSSDVPYGSILAEFLDAAFESLSTKLIDFAISKNLDCFIERHTSIVGIRADPIIQEFDPVIKELKMYEEYDLVENDHVQEHIQEIANYLKVEEEIYVEFTNQMLIEARNRKWLKDEATDETKREELETKTDEEKDEESEEEMDEKMTKKLYAEYLMSQTAKNTIEQEKEEIMEFDEWKNWWWKKNVRFKMHTNEPRNEKEEKKRTSLMVNSLITKLKYQKALGNLENKVLDQGKIEIVKGTVDTTGIAHKPKTKKRKWTNPWYMSKERLKLLKISLELKENKKMRVKSDK